MILSPCSDGPRGNILNCGAEVHGFESALGHNIYYYFFSQGTGTLVGKSPYSTARYIALFPDSIPSLAVLHTEKALQSWGIVREDKATVCIVEPYSAPYIAILSKTGKGRHVQMYMWPRPLT